MKFSKFCDMVENTEQEQQFMQLLKKDEDELRKALKKAAAMRIPVVAKLLAAICALIDAENVAAFRQSKHYRYIMNWDIDVNYDAGSLSISPSDEQKKKLIKILSIVGAGLALLLLCRKCCRRRKRS